MKLIVKKRFYLENSDKYIVQYIKETDEDVMLLSWNDDDYELYNNLSQIVKKEKVTDKKQLNAFLELLPDMEILFVSMEDYQFFKKAKAAKKFENITFLITFSEFSASKLSNEMKLFHKYKKHIKQVIFFSPENQELWNLNDVSQKLIYSRREFDINKINIRADKKEIILWDNLYNNKVNNAFAFVNQIKIIADTLKAWNYKVFMIGTDDELSTTQLQTFINENNLATLIYLVDAKETKIIDELYENAKVLCDTSNGSIYFDNIWRAIQNNAVILHNDWSETSINPFAYGKLGYFIELESKNNQFAEMIIQTILHHHKLLFEFPEYLFEENAIK